ncbi:MAG: hypothetical protein LBI39_03695 [Puniceicoccales bacterium]|nr:hypothetical protein [Puniceicoccales bacterium]
MGAGRLNDGSTAGKLLFLIAPSFAQKFIDVLFEIQDKSYDSARLENPTNAKRRVCDESVEKV